MYDIWKLYVENYSLMNMDTQYSSYPIRTKVLTKFSCDLDLKTYRYLRLTILHLHVCMKYESCTLKNTQVIMSEPKCWQSSSVTLTFDLLTPKCIGIFLSYHQKCMLKTTQVIVLEPQSWFVTLTFGPQNVQVSSSQHPASMHEIWSCTLKTTKVFMSEPKRWQNSIVTLTFELLTPTY